MGYFGCPLSMKVKIANSNDILSAIKVQVDRYLGNDA